MDGKSIVVCVQILYPLPCPALEKHAFVAVLQIPDGAHLKKDASPSFFFYWDMVTYNCNLGDCDANCPCWFREGASANVS